MKHPFWRGTLLAAAFVVALVLGRPLGISTAYSIAGGVVHQAVNPAVAETQTDGTVTSSNAYYARDGASLAKKILSPVNAQTALALMVIPGAFLAAVPGRIRRRHEPRVRSTGRGCLAGFAGGFVLLFGARLAGGCTSGMMFSGILQGNVSGYVFAGIVFAVGFAASRLSEGRRGA